MTVAPFDVVGEDKPKAALVVGKIEDITAHGAKTGRWPPREQLKTHTTYHLKYLVATGDLMMGYKFYGPFAEYKLAEGWARDNIKVGEVVRVIELNEVRS